jgi:hypothetical protein
MNKLLWKVNRAPPWRSRSHLGYVRSRALHGIPFVLLIIKKSYIDHRNQLKVCPYQSEDGNGLGSWIFISLSQQTGLPSPALVHSTSVPHASQRYLLPS